MIYLSPDRNSCVVYCSCGDDGQYGPHLTITYFLDRDGYPDLTIYAHEGKDPRTLWRRVKEAAQILFGKEPRWPDVLCLLGANERDSEVGCVKALAEWLDEKADQYRRDLKEWQGHPDS